jgi:CheY-like chemotaxis protein
MKTILIVDDQPDIRRLLLATLGKQFTLVEAEDGAAALKAIQQHRPALVLLDVMMPGELDGLQVLEQTKSNPHTRDTLVAVLSARGQAVDQAVAREKGADAYFIKPFSPLQVVGWVRSKLA